MKPLAPPSKRLPLYRPSRWGYAIEEPAEPLRRDLRRLGRNPLDDVPASSEQPWLTAAEIGRVIEEEDRAAGREPFAPRPLDPLDASLCARCGRELHPGRRCRG